ncbi:MAG TPA: DUF1587 domain-containing protein, partial [Pirellulaceae bacterium]|nr:DUF1587 domain-containing protein [Pirellulaceae bacterium]
VTSRLRSLAAIPRRFACQCPFAPPDCCGERGQVASPRRVAGTDAFVPASRVVVAAILGLFVFPAVAELAPVGVVTTPTAAIAQAQTASDGEKENAKKNETKKADTKKADAKKADAKKAEAKKSGVKGDAAAAGQADPFQANVIPLVRKYCFECHGEKKQEAEVALHKFSDEAAAQGARATWEKVLELVEGQTMPPAERPQPTAAERRQLVRWLEHTLFDLDCTQEHDPGRVTIRRLNRVEYNNTVRDLLGVSFRPADDFPSDDVGHGFDNIGDVLSVSPLLVEKYLNAAEKIASAAVARTVVAKPAKLRRQGKELEDVDGAKLTLFGVHSITSRGTVTGKFDIPRDGDYVVRVRAAGQQAGTELPKMEIQVDDKSVKTFDVSAIPDKPADHDLRLRLTQGSRKISATFINDFYDPQAADPKLRDRNLFVGA